MKNPLHQTPPDDTGTDTLKRFRYQAQLALPFCLACARKEKIRSIIMEHFEDIVIEYDDYWHFIQVKTRNAERGPWKLGDAIDGLKSLYRAFQETSHLEAKYSLFIEGAISSTDDLNALAPRNTDISDKIIHRISEKLEIEDSKCRVFLKSVTVHPNQPPRANITSHNIHLMGQVSASTTICEIASLEEKLTDEILRAMSCARLDNLLYYYIAKVEETEDGNRARVDAKRLTASNITDILGSLTIGDYPLLRRITDLNAPTLTKLEKKLVAGGATERIIKDAKNLRANASMREAEILASGFVDQEDKMTDVQFRIQTLTNSIVENHDEAEKPAKIIWRMVLHELTEKKESVDPHRLYKQDPYLLLGAVCGLSDECRIDWGVKIA
ncbi:dsDNA nuclease domain-containing protein [Microcoleus sp. Pol12A5]|uniref:dsDNA nuclease domain-containing protein n=1 Tax=Microcoleus sp. Pol12A5 TaxID=3055392 RepID=UPI002FD41C4C